MNRRGFIGRVIGALVAPLVLPLKAALPALSAQPSIPPFETIRVRLPLRYYVRDEDTFTIESSYDVTTR